MLKIFTIVFLMLPVVGISQTESNVEIQLVGIWVLTDFNNSEKFRDTWEFTSDSVFKELKYRLDGDTILVPDENGTWSLANRKLKIIVTGEDVEGEQKKYSQPEVIEFEISKVGEEIIICAISRNGIMMDKKNKLRLRKIKNTLIYDK